MSRKREVTLEIHWNEREGGLQLRVRNSWKVELFNTPIRRNPGHSTEILCEEILRAYKRGEVEEQPDGEGEPTTSQLRHWEFHLVQPKPDQCEICAEQFPKRAKRLRAANIVAFPGKVEVKRVKREGTQSTPKPLPRSTKSAEDLGF